MTLVDLHVTPQDVRSRELGVRWGAPRPEVLTEITVEDGQSPFRLNLAVIGASHVVEVTRLVENADHVFREEISCLALESGQKLRGGVEKESTWGNAEYRLLTRRVTHADLDAVEAHARKVKQSVLSEQGLVGAFPGAGECHLTALWGRVEPTEAQWKTWHFYPEEKVVVESESQLKIGGTHGQ